MQQLSLNSSNPFLFGNICNVYIQGRVLKQTDWAAEALPIHIYKPFVVSKYTTWKNTCLLRNRNDTWGVQDLCSVKNTRIDINTWDRWHSRCRLLSPSHLLAQTLHDVHSPQDEQSSILQDSFSVESLKWKSLWLHVFCQGNSVIQ